MALKQAQVNLEKALRERTDQLREIESGVRRIGNLSQFLTNAKPIWEGSRLTSMFRKTGVHSEDALVKLFSESE